MIDNATKVFLSVVECGSFSKAASRLYVTPSAVMKQINRLESAIGVQLLERHPTGVAPTAAGQSYYKDARAMVDMEQAAIKRAKAAQTRQPTAVRIGDSQLNPSRPLLDAWYTAVKERPEWHLDERYKIIITPFSDEDTFDNIFARLNTDIDLLTSAIDDRYVNDTIGAVPLWESHLCVLVPGGHPLARIADFSLDDLNGYDIISAPVGAVHSIDALRAYLAGTHPDIHLVTTRIPMMGIATFNYCAVEGLPMLTHEAWANVHPAFVRLPIEWDFHENYGVLYAKSKRAELEPLIELISSRQFNPWRDRQP
ncbi:LysR family transcriptional regulator [Bifidobacterium lemurum]|uniref:LysR family transcriptional regulator n=1 Tax=Bifidobacterium lemurum TaxID=1603886 RepID=A0A261FL53_9BIFI|nr:LysR family transcriptional regulator [Bifidobacterium lemurum]OZG59735.1 LysR family transcriptional regulator [Bifidobacterium lemurum]QOL35029.1 LysR family transcriptional regulator [Bifidobacterium lemurum]